MTIRFGRELHGKVLPAMLVAILAATSGNEVTGAGPEAIRADAQSIEFRHETDRPTTILEILPHLTPHATNAIPVGSLVRSGSTVSLPRFENGRDRIYSGFAIGISNANAPAGVSFLGTWRYVEQFDQVSRFRQPFPQTTSKKGLQVQMLEDAIQLGVKHASLNVNLTGLVALRDQPGNLPWTVDESVVHFRRDAIESLDRQVRTLTDAGVVVSFILLTYASGDPKLDSVMLHPGYDRSAPNHLGAFNTETVEGVRHFRGCLEFLADRYSNPTNYGGRVANYILGNEVNSHWFWSNMGPVSMETFADSYLRAARLANTALRKASSSARLYLSLEHHWSIRYPGGKERQAFPGRPFLDYFNEQARAHGDFEWHLAFHPYPENLFEPRTWNDRSATTNDNTPRITFKNLEVLMRYLEQPTLRRNGDSRRVILSEQGFHTADGPNGELWQAAAYAYAYYKTARIPGIDAFILHRHVDHGQEGGLRLGLWTRDPSASFPAAPKAQKKIYELFRAADTPAWEEASAFALPVIGIQRWEDLR